MTKSAMQNLLKDYTRRANRRLRDLERAGLSSSSNAYRYVERLAYDREKDSTTTLSETGKIKFRTDIKNMSEKELKKQLAILETFLTSKTSTIGGINRKYKKAYETFKNNVTSNISFEDYISMYDYEALIEYQKMYGSQAMNELVIKNGIDKAVEIANIVMEKNKRKKEDAEKNNIEFEEVSLEEIEEIMRNMKKG